MKLWIVCFALALLSLPVRGQESVAHGRFRDVKLYRPSGDVDSVALFLSGSDGWNATTAALAQELTEHRALVVGIDLPQLLRNLDKDGGKCVFPDGDLENLSHYLQGYAKLATYRTPLLVGYESGASFAYAMLAQAPAGTFAAALSVGFCPTLPMRKALCRGDGFSGAARADKRGFDIQPRASLPVSWIALQGENDRRCDIAEVKTFAQTTGNSQIITLTGTTQDYAATRTDWQPLLIDAYRKAAAHHAASLPPPPTSLSDLPLVEVMAQGAPASTFAVLLSGDGGWAGLDRSVADALAAKGIAVVGFDSLRYFWSARTPQGLATDLDRLIRFYAAHWKKEKVVLVGYSQGADVLPFAVNRLPSVTRERVARTVLIGLGTFASFEFHLGNWLGGDSGGLAIIPETRTLGAATTLCLYGKDDDNSSCPKIPASQVRSEVLPGGHHFDGAYGVLAERILLGL